MQSTNQAALVSAGGADLSHKEMRLYHRRRRGGFLTPYELQWLNALFPAQLEALEEMAVGLDASDREMRRFRRAGGSVIDGGRVLGPLVAPRTPAGARPRGSRRTARRHARSSVRSGDSGDDGAGAAPAPRLTLAEPPRAIVTYAVLTLAQRGEAVT